MIPIKVILFSRLLLLWKRIEIVNNPACLNLCFGHYPEML
ncbi:hypothetical protein NEIFLAOT_01601 [Neisseria flavescens NRL30031/H210]|uniref:Uncharacterized protein n=1 Tax=Neisseria flavescens NRL30031/H210 TaxID=546264 RepID=C0ENR4_NEIFL|nr:hypothetical protein NEIFLAOT_01601 [Neisseria flavescens NRL30031/H210]